MRMPSFKVLNQADARPWHLQELLKSRGCWRILVFAGDIKAASATAQKEKIDALGSKLGGADSFLKKYTPKDKRYDAVIEVLTIHASPRQSTTIFDFPIAFRPWDEREGWDYWKIFVDDVSYHEGHGRAYENYGIDKEKGCVVVVRPDGYVSTVLPLEVGDGNGVGGGTYSALEGFFRAFMVEQREGERNEGIGKGPVAEVEGVNGVIDEGRKEGMAIRAGDEATSGLGGS